MAFFVAFRRRYLGVTALLFLLCFLLLQYNVIYNQYEELTNFNGKLIEARLKIFFLVFGLSRDRGMISAYSLRYVSWRGYFWVAEYSRNRSLTWGSSAVNGAGRATILFLSFHNREKTNESVKVVMMKSCTLFELGVLI